MAWIAVGLGHGDWHRLFDRSKPCCPTEATSRVNGILTNLPVTIDNTACMVDVCVLPGFACSTNDLEEQASMSAVQGLVSREDVLGENSVMHDDHDEQIASTFQTRIASSQRNGRNTTILWR